jgi:hypothetical protein
VNELFQSLPRWTAAVPWGGVAALLLVIVGYFAYRVLAHRIGDQVADAERRHLYRKRIRYAVGMMVLVTLIVLFIDRIRELGTLLGFVGAGVAIALREYLASVLAWFYILTQRTIALGSRIEIGSARGDVIDIGLFKLTLVEVRGDGLGEQSSGRLVTIPNYKVLIDPVYMFSSGAPYVWDEMDFLERIAEMRRILEICRPPRRLRRARSRSPRPRPATTSIPTATPLRSPARRTSPSVRTEPFPSPISLQPATRWSLPGWPTTVRSPVTTRER